MDANAASRAHPARGILLMIAAVTVLALLDTTAKYLSHSYPVPGVVWARSSPHLAKPSAEPGPQRFSPAIDS